MKALRFFAREDVRLVDIAEPVCGPEEVKIKVKNCSTCGTDVKILHNGHVNITRVTTMGHEVAGEVVEVGPQALGGFQVGDRVQCIAAVPCGECHECRKGWMEVCQNQTSVGYQYDGGFAEYMIVPKQVLKVDGLNQIPENVGYDEASAAEPFACAINAQEQLGIQEGDFVVVFGAGPIGCMHIRIARGVHKAGMIALVDINAERLAMSADAVHPDHVIDASSVDVVEEVMRLTGGRGADVVITATPAKITQEQAIAMAARNGRISFFGGLPKNTGPLPAVAHPWRERLVPGPQQARSGVHLNRPSAGEGPDHPTHPARTGTGGLRDRPTRRSYQGDRRALTAPQGGGRRRGPAAAASPVCTALHECNQSLNSRSCVCQRRVGWR